METGVIDCGQREDSCGNINCVILNYNDADTTEKLVGQIRGYRCFRQIVIVDNASTDDSLQRLEKLADKRITVLRADRNGGYGAGNNLGVRYAALRNHAAYVVIANPDVSFEESCVTGLARVLKRHPEAGVAAALMENGDADCAWRHYGFWGQLLFMGPVSRRVFKPFLYYPRRYFRGKKAVWVDSVHGSMLMVDAAAFLECGGYDEGIFLYQEEMVLADRMKTIGRRTALVPSLSYRHDHSVSVSKTFEDELARQRLRETSVLYYMKHYLCVNRLEECLARLWFWGIRFEVRAVRWILSR